MEIWPDNFIIRLEIYAYEINKILKTIGNMMSN